MIRLVRAFFRAAAVGFCCDNCENASQKLFQFKNEYIYKHKHTHTYIHTYVYMYTHKHKHKHKHKYIHNNETARRIFVKKRIRNPLKDERRAPDAAHIMLL